VDNIPIRKRFQSENPAIAPIPIVRGNVFLFVTLRFPVLQNAPVVILPIMSVSPIWRTGYEEVDAIARESCKEVIGITANE
jgi:hypothetical protein